MNLEKLRIHKAHSRWLEGFFVQNPVFTRGLALPFAIVVTNNLKYGVAVSILMACSLVPCVLLSRLIGQRLPKWPMLMICALLSMVIIMMALPLVTPISAEITDTLGIYIPILSLNSIISFLCLRHRRNQSFLLALVDAITYSCGFALALCLISALRELWGANTIWGIPVSLPLKMGGLQIAFSGFLVTALLSALFRAIERCFRARIYRLSNPSAGKEGSFS